MKKENTIENELPVKKPSVMYETKMKDDEVEETFDCNECGETTYIEEHSYNNGMCHNCIKEK
jgi:formylmethanofuran dehydrogenase subunit E